MEKRSGQVLMVVGSLAIVLFAGCSTSTQKATNAAEPVPQNTAKPIVGETPPVLKHPSPSDVAEKPGVAKPMTVQAKILTKAYMDDEAAADAKYKRNKIAVVGKITDIDTSGKDIIVWLEGHTPRISLVCHFYDEEQRIRVNMLKKGEIVKLIGSSSGFSVLKTDIEFAAREVAPPE